MVLSNPPIRSVASAWRNAIEFDTDQRSGARPVSRPLLQAARAALSRALHANNHKIVRPANQACVAKATVAAGGYASKVGRPDGRKAHK
jgi:hypothetical protein